MNPDVQRLDIPSLARFLAIGLFAGFLSGLLGIKGGIVVIPILVYLVGWDQRKAQGTSLVMMLPPVGILAVMKYYRAGNVEIRAALIMAAAFFAAGHFGALFAEDLPTRDILRLFGVVLLIVGVCMLFSRPRKTA
jgi:uncharacterized protein